jgi:protein LSM14
VQFTASVLDLIGGGSRSTTPVSLLSRKSPTADIAVQTNQGAAAGGHNQRGENNNRRANNNQSQRRDSNGRERRDSGNNQMQDTNRFRVSFY